MIMNLLAKYATMSMGELNAALQSSVKILAQKYESIPDSLEQKDFDAFESKLIDLCTSAELIHLLSQMLYAKVMTFLSLHGALIYQGKKEDMLEIVKEVILDVETKHRELLEKALDTNKYTSEEYELISDIYALYFQLLALYGDARKLKDGEYEWAGKVNEKDTTENGN